MLPKPHPRAYTPYTPSNRRLIPNFFIGVLERTLVFILVAICFKSVAETRTVQGKQVLLNRIWLLLGTYEDIDYAFSIYLIDISILNILYIDPQGHTWIGLYV